MVKSGANQVYEAQGKSYEPGAIYYALDDNHYEVKLLCSALIIRFGCRIDRTGVLIFE